jgi:hypothetical protein
LQLALALAICETCPPPEVDFIIPVLLNLFDTRTSLMNLLKAIIEREVAQAGLYSFWRLFFLALTIIFR